MSVTVRLEPWEYAHALDVGTRRFAANWGKGDAQWYADNRDRMEDQRTAEQASAIAELAVAKHTNRYWSGHVWHASEHHKYRDIPDVGRNIEVRRVRTQDATVREHQVGKGLAMWVARPVPPEFVTVELWGWLPYDEAWELGLPAPYRSEGCRTVPREALRDPDDNGRTNVIPVTRSA